MAASLLSRLRSRRVSTTLFAALLAAGLLSAFDAGAFRFGGGGFGGGFDRGGYHFDGGGLDAGYRGFHPMFGDDVRPQWGSGDGDLDGDRFDHDTFTRNINVDNNFYNRPYNGLHPNWADGGYWRSRPWNTGWYHWAPDTWGWWGASAAAWGLAGLATGAAITELVNNAAADQSAVILVPETEYQLNYGSVDAVGTRGASFAYTLSGGPTLQGAANCAQGLLNGQPPQSAADAQLLNAVCQVAYGSGA